MKAAVLTAYATPPTFADFDEPVARAGNQVVVEMAAAAVHHLDLARASGTFYLGRPGDRRGPGRRGGATGG